MATTGSSENLNPAALPSPEGTTLKLNLPKRKPSFSIENTGRNLPCPCGSGKKFKQCCGKDD
jgi:preprotein translocase subunit SecA